MSKHEQITGIVLAGGKSLRMGTDKGLMFFRGKPLVKHAIDLLSIFCDRILISSNNPEYNTLGYEVITDELSGAGPMAGIASGLTHSRTEINMVISCDMPLADPVILLTLLELSEGVSFVVPLDSMGRIEPLCAIYKKSSLDMMLKLLAEKSFRMTGIFSHGKTRMVAPGEYPITYSEQWFMNINSIEDFERAGNS